MVLSDELREAREAKGMSLRQLEGASGVSFARISKIETGKISVTFKDLVRLGRGLEVSDLTLQSWVSELTKLVSQAC